MVRFVNSLLLVKKNKSKTLSWMESDLILLLLFVLYSKFYSLLSNSKESVLADPNTHFYFKIFIPLLQESFLLHLEQQRETHLHSKDLFTGGKHLLCQKFSPTSKGMGCDLSIITCIYQ